MSNPGQALKDITRLSRYAQYLRKKNRRETWEEQVHRVFRMHRMMYADQLVAHPELERYIAFAEKAMLEQRVLGSQRALQFGGPAILRKHARIYNCAATYMNRMRSFQEVMWLLLCGCGVGISVQKHHIDQLPDIAPLKKLSKKRKKAGGFHLLEPLPFVIEDSIEGWADSLGVLMSSYFTSTQTFPKYHGREIKFDFSNIRPKGAAISFMSGKAPGPEPLERSLNLIKEVIENTLKMGLDRLRPIDVFDIVMHSSDAVLAGGIRRSALLSIFSLTDDEMMKAKTGNWFIDNPQRGRSNNSVLLLRDEVTAEQFDAIFENTKQFGEPGFIWANDKETLFNPCVPDDTWVMTANGSKQVKDLLNTPFKAIVNGKPYASEGFVKTGVQQPVYEITTKEGFVLRATANHKIMTDKGWKETGELMPDDTIIMHSHPNVITNSESDDFIKGCVLGSLYGDGTFWYFKGKRKTKKSEGDAFLQFWEESRYKMRDIMVGYLKKLGLLTNHFKGGNEHAGRVRVGSRALFRMAQKYIQRGKILTDAVESESLDFQAGFLRGWFDADGSVQGAKKNGRTIRLTCNNFDSLQRGQRMCMRLGIYARIYKNRRSAGKRRMPDGKGGHALFDCKAVHEIIISSSSLIRYRDVVGFNEHAKTTKLSTLLESYVTEPKNSKFISTVDEVNLHSVQDVYDCEVAEVHAFDAQGWYVSNCVEVSLYAHDPETKTSGSEMCNLSEINMKKVGSKRDFVNACVAASILGTLQAGYTSFPYLGKATENIIRREALLGCSMTGMMDRPKFAFDARLQREGAEEIKRINKIIARLLGINPSARTTCIKPSGSASCVLGTASGIHPHHSRKYFRRIQCTKIDPVANFYAKYNPQAVEHSVWSNNNTDNVITTLARAEPGAIVKADLTAIDLLEKVKLTQQNWVTSGRDPALCTQRFLNHNVSNTVNVQADEWGSVAEFIYKNRNNFAGISLLSHHGDKDYQQAPFQEVRTEEEIAELYGPAALFASGLIIHAMQAFDDNLYAACTFLLTEEKEMRKENDRRQRHKNDTVKFAEEMLQQAKDERAEIKAPEYEEYEAACEKYARADAALRDAQSMCVKKVTIVFRMKIPKIDTEHITKSLKTIEEALHKKSWIMRAVKFSERYFDGDLKKMTYCLKEVDALKKWHDLSRTYTPVPWEELVETVDNTKPQQYQACGGGKCMIWKM